MTTKELIISKATELFLTLGFKSVTMDDIAQQIGISKKTLYIHFQNKTTLIEEATFELFAKISSGIDQICDHSANPIEELYDVKRFVMSHMKNERMSPQFQLKKYYPEIHDLLWKNQFDKMYLCIQNSIRKGIDTGLFRQEIDPDFTARLYFNGMMGIRDERIFPPASFTLPYLENSFLEYHLRALVTEKGMSILQDFISTNHLQNEK
jgi:AcrR family transcriptional regulator